MGALVIFYDELTVEGVILTLSITTMITLILAGMVYWFSSARKTAKSKRRFMPQIVTRQDEDGVWRRQLIDVEIEAESFDDPKPKRKRKHGW